MRYLVPKAFSTCQPTTEDRLELIWRGETGGPPIVKQPQLTGFGSRLIARTVPSQLGGQLTYDWQETGLVVTITIPVIA